MNFKRNTVIKQVMIFIFILIFAFTSNGYAKKIHLSQTQEIQFKNLAGNLRCVVCNNESIYESDTPIANNIRNLIRIRLNQGQDPVLIKDYLHKRYGDVILLTPPLNKNTFAFWTIVAIILLFLFSVIILVMYMSVSNKFHKRDKYQMANDQINNNENPTILISNKKMIVILTPMIALSCIVFLIIFVKLEAYTSYKSINSFNININKIDNEDHLSREFCENPSIDMTIILMGQKEKIKTLANKCLKDYPHSTYVKSLRNTFN